ncbi:uncharacterized protein LOC106639420 [Copidosoma floridanum]|uniref:uncharacterized protein LOC106639420 n=1 Tax=Copidosoma floridanum TaxID=29053 RepID=UPI0006C9BAA9|nr:uncharacterized protein LOC106639420 [Copidosoma floridanum]
MVVSHRESSISSNIRAIIEQLNLDPLERRRLIESRPDDVDRCKQQLQQQRQEQRTHQLRQKQVESSGPRVTIGVYGLGRRVVDENKRNTATIELLRTKKPLVPRPRQRVPEKIELEDKVLEVPKKDASTPTTPTTVDTPTSPFKEDLQIKVITDF